MNKAKELRKKLLKKAKREVREQYVGPETHVIKSVALLEDLENAFNLLYEDCREWYGVHFPELDRLLRNPELYLKLVKNLGNRQNFSETKIAEYYNNSEKTNFFESTVVNYTQSSSMNGTWDF